MEQKEPAGGQKRMSSVTRKYIWVCLFLGEKVCLGSWCMRDKCMYCTCLQKIMVSHWFRAQVMEFSSKVRHLVWSIHICLTVYTSPQDQKLTSSESEEDRCHNSSTGYSHFVSVWSCICIWQYVDILDQFPLTLVSCTLSLIFHHQDSWGWFLITNWLLSCHTKLSRCPVSLAF